MHKCDNPKCVNPDHLQLGTQLENIADCKSKGRTKRSKLLPHIDEIFRKRAEGYSHQKLADEYMVSRPLITLLFTDRLLTNRSIT